MSDRRAVVGVFADHHGAFDAVEKLTAAGFAPKDLSVVGRGGHGVDATVAIHGAGGRMSFVGSRGAFWGGLWGLFFGGLFVAAPEFGIVVVLGYLAATTLELVKSESAVGSFRDLASALFNIGFPRESATRYEAVVKDDHLLVIAHGSGHDMERAKSIIAAAVPEAIEISEAGSRGDHAINRTPDRRGSES